MTNTKAAIIADNQSIIRNDDINEAAVLRTMAFTTNVNKPSVKILMGKVRNNKIGRRIALSKPISKLAIKADLKLLISKPFTNLDVMSNAKADKSHTNRI